MYPAMGQSLDEVLTVVSDALCTVPGYEENHAQTGSDLDDPQLHGLQLLHVSTVYPLAS